MPHGAWMAIGNIFRRATLSSLSTFASRRPVASTGIESGPPTVEIGTIGTPLRIASLMKPVRPAEDRLVALGPRPQRVALAPGHSATSWPAASAAAMLSGRRRQHAHAPEVGADAGQRP